MDTIEESKESRALQQEAMGLSSDSAITTQSLAERDKTIRGNWERNAADALQSALAPLGSESLESSDSKSIHYRLSINSSNTQSSIDDGDATDASRTIFSGTSGEDMLSSQSQSFSIESVSTEATQPTSPGRPYGSRPSQPQSQSYPSQSQSQSYSIASVSTDATQPTSPGRPYGSRPPFSPGETSRATNNSGFTTDGYSSDDATTSYDDDEEEDEEDETTVPSLPSLGTGLSSKETPRRWKAGSIQMSPGRIPGGAAAKLMLIGPRNDQFEDEEELKDGELRVVVSGEETGEAELEVVAKNTEESEGMDRPDDLRPAPSQDSVSSGVAAENLKELERTLESAKVEFERGTEANRRYQPQSQQDIIHEDLEEAHGGEANPVVIAAGPRFMNPSENFHETAEAAIASLLSPRDYRTGDSFISNSHSELGLVTSSSAASAFQAPRIDTAFTTGTSDGLTPRTPRSPMLPFESLARRDIEQKLIAPETEKTLREMPGKMHDPNKTLTDLLTAIASLQDKSSMDLGYMVRRKNACGALQVLTANVKNRERICWTVGVLPALTSVLADTCVEGPKVAFADRRIRIEFVEARKRAIAALTNLAMPTKNRVPVFHTPDLISWIVVVIMEDSGAAQRGCCAILAYLAKSPENRLLLVQVPGLMNALIKVLRPRPPRLESPYSSAKKIYPWSSNEDSFSSDDEGKPTSPASFKSVSFKSVRKDNDSDSEKTPRVGGTKPPVELVGYDATADETLRGARQNVFALLSHLTKEKDNAYHFARDSALVSTMVDISKFDESPSHTLAIKLLANLTRHRLNTKIVVFKHQIIVPALVVAAEAINDETRLYACYALQNLSQDKSCRQELAITDNLITALCNRSRETRAEEERLAAVSALKNLCDEPANLIPLTNTRDCISTMMQLAHGNEEGVSDNTQYRACDALATLSHWLRKIATSGKTLDDAKRGKQPTKELFVPSLQVVTWDQWQ
jgi:hypothetical protein